MEAVFVANFRVRNWSCDTGSVRSLFLLTVFYFLLTTAFAESSLQSARQAQALLGPDTWSRVIQIENTNAHGVYPRKLYALVFEFSGILWFYTETDGTQSFSLWANRLEQEKADFKPGLLQIDPGFTRYSVVDDTSSPTSRAPRRELPNGCLIESLVAGRNRLGHGDGIRSARLVMYYAKEWRVGHCVLAYETAQGVFVLNPTQDNQARRIGDQWPRDLVDIAQAAWPEGRRSEIKDVRSLNFPLSGTTPSERPVLAALSASNAEAADSSAQVRLPGRG